MKEFRVVIKEVGTGEIEQAFPWITNWSKAAKVHAGATRQMGDDYYAIIEEREQPSEGENQNG